jgi:hypothetical protein
MQTNDGKGFGSGVNLTPVVSQVQRNFRIKHFSEVGVVLGDNASIGSGSICLHRDLCKEMFEAVNPIENTESIVLWRTMHCTAQHCTALHSTTLHCTALHCTAL